MSTSADDPRSFSSYPFTWRGLTLFLPLDSSHYSIGSSLGLIRANDDVRDDQILSECELPLLPEASPLFPGGRSFLFISEMKFRCLFSDVFKKYNNRFFR